MKIYEHKSEFGFEGDGGLGERLIRGEGYGEDARRFQADHAGVWEKTLPGVPLTDNAVLMVGLFELAETPG